MTTPNTPRIVFEQVSLSHRRYHVNAEFGCELEAGIVKQRFIDTVQNLEYSEESVSQLFDFLKEHEQCSFGAALSTLDRCNCDHDGEAGLVDVIINLAYADWSIVHKKVIKLIVANLGWRGEIDVIAAK